MGAATSTHIDTFFPTIVNSRTPESTRRRERMLDDEKETPAAPHIQLTHALLYPPMTMDRGFEAVKLDKPKTSLTSQIKVMAVTSAQAFLSGRDGMLFLAIEGAILDMKPGSLEGPSVHVCGRPSRILD
jgi:hypothetical protein